MVVRSDVKYNCKKVVSLNKISLSYKKRKKKCIQITLFYIGQKIKIEQLVITGVPTLGINLVKFCLPNQKRKRRSLENYTMPIANEEVIYF